jgi:hypothetical protein
MIAVFILTLIPSLLAYFLISKLKIRISSNYFKLGLCWFTGQYFFTIAVFILCLLFSLLTSNVLIKATLSILFLNVFFLFFFQEEIIAMVKNIFNTETIKKRFFNPLNLVLIVFCFLFSYFFFIPHLSYQNDTIQRSPIYWDYHWQMSLIQNFVHGDNFPPENEAFAGIPANYHYFWMVNASIYQAMGLNPVDAINFTSIIQFFFLLIILVGFSMEIFKSKLAGLIAVLLTISSSNLRFIEYFSGLSEQNIFKVFLDILRNSKHPWDVSQITLNSYGYNATMYNLFYFVEERQMIIGVIYLIVSLWLIYNRQQFSSKVLLLIGVLMGGYFIWHLHITLMVLAAICAVLVLDGDRKKTLIMLLGFGAVFLIHYLYFKGITHSEWFLKEINNYPKFNFNYSSMDGTAIAPLQSFFWYAYSYGLKIIFFPLSIFLLFKKNKKIAILIISIFIPTFIILNSLQLSPAFIHDNHKFHRPMNVVIDLAVAYAVFLLFFKQRRFYLYILGIIFAILLSISGIIELMPFINSRPTVVYAKYPNTISAAIRTNTLPSAVFIGEDNESIYLAGRKLFLAKYLRGHDEKVLNRKKRQKIINDIYNASDVNSFCFLTKKYEIDYIEYDRSANDLPDFIIDSKYFSALNNKNNQVIFVDSMKTCRS